MEKITALPLEELESDWEWKQENFRSLYVNNSDAIFAINIEGKIQEMNNAAAKLSGRSIDQLKGNSIFNFFDEKSRNCATKLFQQILIGEPGNSRVNFVNNLNRPIGCLINFTPIKAGDEIVGSYMTLKDMAELDKMISKYVESEKHFHIITENAHDVIVLIDEKGNYLFVSPSAKSVYGFDPEEVFSQSPFSLIHPDDCGIGEQNLLRSIKEATLCKTRLRIKHKTNGWIWSEVNGTPVYDETNRFMHMVMIVRDITLQKEYEAKLEFFAYHDVLTELPNRRFFMERLSNEIKQLEVAGEKFALVILDINDFKNINDKWGHEIGDWVIQEFGKRLEHNKGHGNVAARLGGDEFILLLTNIEDEQQVIDDVRKILGAMEVPWQVEETLLDVTTSIGIAFSSVMGADKSSLLKEADFAMYEAKKVGGNAIKISRY